MKFLTIRTRSCKSFRVNLIVAVAACLVMTASANSATAQELLAYWALEQTDYDADFFDESGNPDNGPDGLFSFFDGDVEPGVEGGTGFRTWCPL